MTRPDEPLPEDPEALDEPEPADALGDDVPDADAVDQAQEVSPGPRRRIPTFLPPEASEGDALEQADELPDPYHDGEGVDRLP